MIFQFVLLVLLVGGLDARLAIKGKMYKGVQQAKVEKLPDGTEVARLYSDEFPYVAELLENQAHLCGGALIKTNIVITAAHCFPKNIATETDVSRYEILAGNHLRADRNNPYAQVATVVSIVPHPRYVVHTDVDLAVVKIEQHFCPNNYVNVINLPVASKTYNHYACEETTALGWGEIENGSLSNTLLKINGHVQDICNGPEVLCIRGFNESVACFGDSGGPQVIHGKDPTKDILIGVISGGATKNDTNHPNGESCDSEEPYNVVSMAYFRSWIRHTVKKM